MSMTKAALSVCQKLGRLKAAELSAERLLQLRSQ
jgi:hypothetical protein